jgi:phospho-N-acetylmuramoyl-pentapeptide-transferase
MLFESLDNSILLRALLAAALCMTAGLVFGNAAIGWLRKRFREPIKSISPTVVRLHLHKQQTPTMGGIFLLVAVVLGTLLFADPRRAEVLSCLLAAIAFAAVGAIDDLVKLRSTRKGISVRLKLAGQFVAAIPCAILLESSHGGGWFAIGASIFVLMVGANAVNLTDGLDGLAAGCGAITAAMMTAVLAVSANSELSIVTGSLAGVLLAFLRFNRHPARVFMGDIGSQMIGALLAICTLAGGSSIAFAIYSGVFLIELASVAIQLASYRLRGRRVFLCAPIHHHYQFAGWSEPRIVRRFWLSAALFAVAGLAVTKIQNRFDRIHGPSQNLAAVLRVENGRPAAELNIRLASTAATPLK